jgi:hypothetical protein
MSTDQTNQISEEKKHELNFTKRCLIISNMQYEEDKIILNPFSFIPLVKLYSATIKQDVFCYTKIKGGLLLLQDKNTQNYHLRIYDSKNYAPTFNLEINADTRKNYVKLESKFYCFNLKCGILGFSFRTEKEAVDFKKLLDAGVPEQSTIEEYEQVKAFNLTDSDNLFINTIENLAALLGQYYQYVTSGEQLEQNRQQLASYLTFSRFSEYYKLLNNTEFDVEDNLFNVYVDKNYPLELFKKMFRHFNMYDLYPIRPIFKDYLNIYNKSNYVDLLVNHLMNNFKIQIEIYKKMKREKKYYMRDPNNSNKESNLDISTRRTEQSIDVIEEDPNEDDDGTGKGCIIGKFFSIFK